MIESDLALPCNKQLRFRLKENSIPFEREFQIPRVRKGNKNWPAWESAHAMTAA